MKDKNHMMVLIDAEKAFDKVKHPLMTKNTQQSGNRGSIPQHNKGHLWEPTVNIILKGQKLKAFPLRSAQDMDVLFTTSIQHSIGSLSHCDQTRKRSKRHPDWKGRSKTVIVCRWHDSVHRKSYRLHQKLFNLISQFDKKLRYKVNIHKSKAFFMPTMNYQK